MINKIVEYVEQSYLKKENIPSFEVGDTVDVHTRIIEGDKERIQVFSGTVIMKKGRRGRLKKGRTSTDAMQGINETFTVRRIVNNEGVERIFPKHSPFIAKVVVRRGGESRRAKLFYLRERVGKAVRLTEKRKEKVEKPAAEKPQVAAEVVQATPELATSTS